MSGLVVINSENLYGTLELLFITHLTARKDDEFPLHFNQSHQIFKTGII